MKFSHNQHIVTNRIACSKCHSNAREHGELIVSKENCNACHHTRVNTDQECAKCHNFQTEIYNGSYMNQNQPDYMKQGGVNCIDCHSDAVRIIKPAKNQMCLKCHDDSYNSMANDWKEDVKKLLKEAKEEINSLRDAQLDGEQQALVNDAGKLVNDISAYPSIYVHNYDLISSLLSEKIKEMKKLK